MSIQGKVISIDYNEHSESLWEIEVNSQNQILYFTDLADSPKCYENIIGEIIVVSGKIQLADIIKEDSSIGDSIKFPNKNSVIRLSGKITNLVDEDEF